MTRIYDLLGRWFYPRRQGWEQRKLVQIMMGTLAFTLTLGLVMAALLRMMYNHEK